MGVSHQIYLLVHTEPEDSYEYRVHRSDSSKTACRDKNAGPVCVRQEDSSLRSDKQDQDAGPVDVINTSF